MQSGIHLLIAFLMITVSTMQPSTEPPCLNSFESELTVNTTSGVVKGTNICLSITERIVAFLGIPYAEPPVNDLRFMPPVKKSRWNGTLEAFQFGKACLCGRHGGKLDDVCDRVWTRPPSQHESDRSEDCLTLNIYSPSLTGSYPVLFFVHGGSYRAGAGGLHPGEKLSHSGAVVVTFNYRLGIFGFLSTGTSAAPGNYGLRDQIMALEWVNENIQQFGGNPRNITMIGQSAGASAVHLHLLSTRTKDLFSSAIIMSGVALSAWAANASPSDPYMQAALVSAHLGCLPDATTSTIDMISCLRNKNESDLLTDLDINAYAGKPSNFFKQTWSPVVDGDLISDTPENLMRNGQIQNKPVIFGMTVDEGSLFLNTILKWAAGNETFNVIRHTDFINKTVVELMLEVLHYNDSRAIEAALKFFYFDAPVVRSADTVWENYVKMLSDAIFTVSIVKALGYHSQYRIPTYFYVFDHVYHSPNASLPAWTGVYHGMDMKYMFGCPFKSDAQAIQEPEKSISELMMRLWINFAQFGNPINPDDLTRNIEWSPYEHNNGQYYLNISAAPPTRQEHYRREQMIFWNNYMPVVATFGADNSAAQCATNVTSI